MINIRLGNTKDIAAVGRLYDDLNDYLKEHVNYPGWKKGVYPTVRDAEAGIQEGCLYVAEQEGKIVGSIILRHKQEPAYKTVQWQIDAKEDDIMVVYTFVVHPQYAKQGIGTQMLAFAEKISRQQRVKTLRLDVYEKNTPAISLYEKCEFTYMGTVSLGLEDCGLDWFKLYEKLLP